MYRAASAAAVALALLLGASASNAASPCSNDTFAIDGNSVTIALCVSSATGAPATKHGAAPKAATLDETIAVKGQPPLVRTIPLDAPPTEEPSRTIDDASLAKLGIARTLHLTIEVRTSGVRLEHALLVPGAVTLK